MTRRDKIGLAVLGSLVSFIFAVLILTLDGHLTAVVVLSYWKVEQGDSLQAVREKMGEPGQVHPPGTLRAEYAKWSIKEKPNGYRGSHAYGEESLFWLKSMPPVTKGYLWKYSYSMTFFYIFFDEAGNVYLSLDVNDV